LASDTGAAEVVMWVLGRDARFGMLLPRWLSRLVLVSCLAGCAGVGGSPRTDGAAAGSAGTFPPPTVQLSRTVTGGNEAGAVERGYRRFWAVAASIGALPPGRWWAALSTVATQPLLGDVYRGLQVQRAAGRRDFGTVVPHPRVAAASVGRASVLDCQDASGSGELDVDTGLPRSTGSARTALAGTLSLGPDGVWRVSQLRYLEEPC
jgi:hypothetical protein